MQDRPGGQDRGGVPRYQDPAAAQQAQNVKPSTPEKKPWEFDWTKPQGSELRQKGMEFAGLDTSAIQNQISQAAQLQRQQNINAYNAAIASQRGVNPTALAQGMGQNLANVNAQTAAGAQQLGAATEFGAQQSNQQALLNYYQTLMGGAESKYGTDVQAKTAKRGQIMNLISGLIGGASSGATAAIIHSDKNQKQPIDHEGNLHRQLTGDHEREQKMSQDGQKSVQDFLGSLKPQAFEYKQDSPAYDGGEEHLGVMAQDLEKTPEGKSAVMESPEGKMVDTSKLAMMLAAAMGELHHRVSQLEGNSRGKSS